jgi:hypothetical protein
MKGYVMDFGWLVSRSFQIAWRYKFLWLFGMFASMSSFNFDFGQFSDNSNLESMNFPAYNLNMEMLLPYIYALLIFGLVLTVISIIANIGLIDSVNRIERGGKYGFSIAFSAGLDYFWRYLAIYLIYGVGTGVVFFVSAIFLVLLFKANIALGLLSLLFFIPFFFFVLFAFTNLSSLSFRVLVVRNSSIMDSIYEGYLLLTKRFKDNIIIFLILIGLSIALGILTVIVWAIFSIPISIVIMSMGVQLFYAFIIGFLLGLPISLVLGGYIGVFQSSLYTLFYFELVEPRSKKTEPIESTTPPDETSEPLI